MQQGQMMSKNFKDLAQHHSVYNVVSNLMKSNSFAMLCVHNKLINLINQTDN